MVKTVFYFSEQTYVWKDSKKTVQQNLCSFAEWRRGKADSELLLPSTHVPTMALGNEEFLH